MLMGAYIKDNLCATRVVSRAVEAYDVRDRGPNRKFVLKPMLGLPDVAVGAIIAALITGVVSLLGLIISKEQKVPDFRQSWIDGLRDDIAAVIAHAFAIQGAYDAGFPTDAETWTAVRPDLLGLNEAASKIRLRLNPNEAEAVAVLKRLDEFDAQFASGGKSEIAQLLEIEENLVTEAQVVLKQEWRRVRAGERTYRVARLLAIVVTAVSAVFVAYVTLRKALFR